MFSHAQHRILVVGLTALLSLTTGCVAARPMALSKAAPSIAIDAQQSLALATLRVANVFKTGYQPHFKNVQVKSMGAKEEVLTFEVAAPFQASQDEANQFEEALVSMSLPPGDYQLVWAWVTTGSLLMPGNGQVPIDATFRVPAGKAVYLGRVEAVRRERVGDEPRAGFVLPLLDQSVTGMSGGTFDVKFFDAFDKDLAVFQAEFPALQQVTVERALMTPKPRPPPATAATPEKAPGT